MFFEHLTSHPTSAAAGSADRPELEELSCTARFTAWPAETSIPFLHVLLEERTYPNSPLHWPQAEENKGCLQSDLIPYGCWKVRKMFSGASIS